LASLPKDFSLLKQLTQLSLRNNLLECLPFEFQQLEFLEELNLSGNLLEQFPFELLQLKHLKMLYLGANSIEIIPSAIALLKKYFFIKKYKNVTFDPRFKVILIFLKSQNFIYWWQSTQRCSRFNWCFIRINFFGFS
jgi:Leucine-rich repeat (LRR) protein